MPTSDSVLLVTGASGQLGRRVVELLIEAGHRSIRATTRDPSKLADLAARGVDVRRADFDDAAGLEAAFRGVRRALLVSTDALDRPGRRIAQHEAAIDALGRAGVAHVVYTSLPNAAGSSVSLAPDHAATERRLEASKLDFTILANNLYADLLLFTLPRAVATGRLVDARGQGKASFVTRDDCARVAAAALADVTGGRRRFDVTGGEALDSAQIAAFASEIAGRPVEHAPVDVASFRQGLLAAGLPGPLADVYASFDGAIAKGELANVAPTVRELTGRAPVGVRDFLRERLPAALGGAGEG